MTGNLMPFHGQQWRRLFMKILKWSLGSILLLYLLLAAIGRETFSVMVQVPYVLVCGWIHYLAKILPVVQMNYGMIFSGVAAFALAVSVSHLVLRWLWRQRRPDRPWRWKWTMVGSLMVPVLFGLSIAAGGMIHQTSWLMRESPWVFDASRGRLTKNISNARQIVTVLRMWASDHDGKYPERLEQLFADDVLDNNRILYYVPPVGGTPELFVYLPGLTDSDPGSLPLVIGPHGESRGRWIVARNDSAAQVAEHEEFARAMLEWRQHVGAHH